MHDDGRDADEDTFDSVEVGRTARLRDALTRSALAWVFVVLAVGFIGWFVRFQALPAGASTADVAIHILQLVPSVCAILVPAALLARHPDAPTLAGSLLAGTILFALVQGLVVLADPLQAVFETITPASPELPEIVPLEVLYNGVISVVAAFALGFMAIGLAQTRRYEDRGPGWLTGWLVPAATIFGGIAGVLAAERFYGDAPMSPVLAIYLATTVILGAIRLVVWANLLAVAGRGAMAGEDPRSGWLLGTLGAAAVAFSLVLVNMNNILELPSEDAATWLGYVIVVGYAVGNLVLLAAFAIGLPLIRGSEDDDVDDVDEFDDLETAPGR
jgi:hypothetical protein